MTIQDRFWSVLGIGLIVGLGLQALAACDFSIVTTNEQGQAQVQGATELPTVPGQDPENPEAVPIDRMTLAIFGGGCGEERGDISPTCGVPLQLTCSALDADNNHLGDPEGLVYRVQWFASPPLALTVNNVNLWNAQITTTSDDCFASVICAAEINGDPSSRRSVERFFECIP